MIIGLKLSNNLNLLTNNIIICKINNMRILLDTNILILRENNHIIPDNIAELMRLLNGLENCSIYVHPLSIEEINKDGNIERKTINAKKISSYATLEDYPDYQTDYQFKQIIGVPKTNNDIVDNQLLYCIYRNVADYLITEDQALLNKADILNLETVISINEAISVFKQFYPKTNLPLIKSFICDKAFNFNLSDEIFDSLKEEYSEFPLWWKHIANREVYAYKNDEGKINALLIPKIETNETIDCNPALNVDRVLKICLFKVAPRAQGLKLGERLLRIAFDYAIANNVDKLYLTHFCKEKDYLVYLIERFGFYKYGVNSRGEGVFVKRITKDDNDANTDATYLNKHYYPSFCCYPETGKHIIPIRPEFHKKLFLDYIPTSQQRSLLRDTSSESNSIKKAYICNANTTKIKPNDILLFYRTQDIKCITTLGIVESVYYKQRDPNEIMKLIAKRTVFSFKEISELCKSDVLVILFNQNFNLKREISYDELRKKQIVSGPIQTITEIGNEDFNKIVEGNIDERFIIH